MGKLIAAAVVALASLAVVMPAQAGVITGDFVCVPGVEVVNVVVDTNGVITGDLVFQAGTLVSDVITCDNGVTITNGVITGD